MTRRTLAILVLLLSAQAPATAATFEELVSQGDKAMQSKDYQTAENAYIDALYASHSADAEPAFLSKMIQLYKVSGLTPLDSTVKEKLERLRKAGSSTTTAKQPAVKQPTATAAATGVVPFTGPIAERLISDCRLALEHFAKNGIENFTNLENFQGNVFKLPNSTYQVVCSVDFVAPQARIPVDAITILKQVSPGKFEEVSSDVSPRAGFSFNALPGGPDSFSHWVSEQRKVNEASDSETKDGNNRAQMSNERAENAQLKEIEEKTRQAEENSNSSNQKSKKK